MYYMNKFKYFFEGDEQIALIRVDLANSTDFMVHWTNL